MTLPVSGAISFNNINVELGVSGTTQASLGQASYRTLAGVASGAISMSDFYGKANAFSFTISSNQTNANLRTLAINAGWSQSGVVTATVAAGVYIYSTDTGTPGLTIDGSFPSGVTLVNNGYIMGQGGRGGDTGAAGGAGGSAISLGVSCTITNNSYIGGGGGGGGGAPGVMFSTGSGGGGAGGGAGGSVQGYGGAGGGPGASGSDGTGSGFGVYSGGGGGGRIFPGVGGAPVTGTTGSIVGLGGGAGGSGSGFNGTTGGGGSAGNAGTSPSTGTGSLGGGGGGWGASGSGGQGSSGAGAAGGSGGRAIQLNGYTATRNGGGTTYGAVS